MGASSGYTVRHKANAFLLIARTHARAIYLVHFSSFCLSFRFVLFRLFCSFSPLTSFFFSPCFALFSLFVLLVFCAQHGEWVAVGGWAVAGQITHTPLGTCINTFAHIMKMTCRRKRTGKSVGAKCVFRLSATPTRIYIPRPDQPRQAQPTHTIARPPPEGRVARPLVAHSGRCLRVCAFDFGH